MEAMVKLANDLTRWKRDNPKPIRDEDEHYGDNRHTYCNLMYYIDEATASRYHKQGWHKMEVRSFNITMDYSFIEIGVVNWTLTAGHGTLRVTADMVHNIKILEDEPTLQVLYG